MLRPPWDTLPPAFQAARAHHIGVNPQHPPLDLLGAMRAAVDRNGGMPTAIMQLPALQGGPTPLARACSTYRDILEQRAQNGAQYRAGRGFHGFRATIKSYPL